MTAMQTALSASLVALIAVPARAEEPLQPPGEVQPEPRKPTGTFTLGAGYSTDDGFLAHARIEQPRLFGTDKLLALDARISEREQDFRLIYEDPTLFDSQLRLRGDLFARKKWHPGFARESVGIDLAMRRRIAPHTDVFVGWRGEHVTALPDATASALREPGEVMPGARHWRGGFLSALRAGIEYDSRTARYYPREGTRAGLSIEIADRRIGSELDFTRIDTWLEHHRPLGPFTLHVAAKATSLTDGLPISERLHFDGSSDVRGFAPGAVGPRDPVTGLPTGGNFLWTARAELEAPLLGDLAIAGFVDAGGLRSGAVGETAASAGVGLIWRSPIGPLRFDVAYPLAGEDRGARFIFGIGGIF